MRNIFVYAKTVVLSPRSFWSDIKEGKFPKKDAVKFAVIFSAFPSLFSFLGLLIFRMNALRQIGVWKGIVIFLVLSYGMFLLLPFIMGYIIESVAVAFGGVEVKKGLEVAVYSSTPFWLASAVDIFPILFPVSLVGALYTITLLFFAGRIVFEIPSERTPTFSFVVASVWLILTFIFAVLLGALSFGGIVVGVPLRM